MEKELQKRILSSIVLIPLSLFFIIKGSLLFNFFLIIIFFITSYEWFMMSKNKSYHYIGYFFLIFSFYAVYSIRNKFGDEGENLIFFLFILLICISTDIDIKIYNNFLEQIKDDIDHIYHYNFDYKILLDYKIPDFRMQETNQWQKPSKYLLIGPIGDIVYNNAKSPSKGFEYDFRLLIGK